MNQAIRIHVKAWVFWAVLAGLAAMLLACGGDGAAEPAPAQDGNTEATAVPDSPTATPRLLAEGLPTLVLPTYTPAGGSSPGVSGSGEQAEPTERLPVIRRPGDTTELPATRTPEPTLAPPQVHGVTYTPGPTVPGPSELAVSQALAATLRSCGDQFRQMLVIYDGVEEFGPEVARRLSEEFVEIRPDCLAGGWDPVFSDPRYSNDPFVCEPEHLLNAMSYHPFRGNSILRMEPTSRRVDAINSNVVELNIHFDRVPMLSDVPQSVFPVETGLEVGGCWFYRGSIEGGGFWDVAYIKYRIDGRKIIRRGPWVRNHRLPVHHPECDRLLQATLDARLDAGQDVDWVIVGDAVDESRAMAPDICGAEAFIFSWNPSLGKEPVTGCPVSVETGVQPDGSFVVNWILTPKNSHGYPACWIRSPDGEWLEYLSPE